VLGRIESLSGEMDHPDTPPTDPPAISSHSPFYTDYSRQERQAFIKAALAQDCGAGCSMMAFLPLCPPPAMHRGTRAASSRDADYKAEIDNFRQGAIPAVFIHSAINVLHEDL